jgi:hypothetical protein
MNHRPKLGKETHHFVLLLLVHARLDVETHNYYWWCLWLPRTDAHGDELWIVDGRLDTTP